MTKSPGINGSGNPKWIIESAEGVVLRTFVQPKASRSEISGEHGEGESIRLKIRIAAPPVEGAANDELLHFLKKITQLAGSRIHIVRGSSSRAKDVFIQGASASQIVSMLLPRK